MAKSNNKLKWRFDVNTFRLLGRDLITDRITALFELVKNAYDANAQNVSIKFLNVGTKNADSKIIIEDDGIGMSLDDIENKIVRPVFNDPRIHYGLNCAAIGCPNLRAEAFKGNSLDRALDEQTRAFINNSRGAFVEDSKLTVSRIFLWYAGDYGEGEADIVNHLRQYAEPVLRENLTGVDKIERYEYDWSLNDAARLQDE